VYNKLLKTVTCSWLDFECHILFILLSILYYLWSPAAMQCNVLGGAINNTCRAQHTSSSNVPSQCAFVFLQVTGSSSNGPLEIQQDFD